MLIREHELELSDLSNGAQLFTRLYLVALRYRSPGQIAVSRIITAMLKDHTPDPRNIRYGGYLSCIHRFDNTTLCTVDGSALVVMDDAMYIFMGTKSH